ncbi:MAG: PAS domain S-box protein, partial [Proteobacteria bacterium]|nr:PAS domain S-box protein [Pseudomonadota bacterium]
LPGRDGLEVLKEIRRCEAPPPVVMVTGRGDERVAVEAMKAGAYDYVVKQEGYLQWLPVVARHSMETNRLAMEHKRAEEALRESEEKYRTLFNEIQDGICLANAETGIIIDCNQALAALVCRERAELIGQSQTILHPPQDDKSFSPTFKQHLIDKQGQILETQVVTRTGDIREVEIKANFLFLQGRKMLQGLFHDITEHKRAEEAIKKSEEKFHLLFDNAVEGIYQTAPEGWLISVNMAFARMFGYESPKEAIKTVTNIAHQMYANPDDRKRTVGILVEKGFLKDFECQMRRKDGSIFWASINARFTKTQDGIPCLEGFIIDITKRKQAEEALKLSEQKYRSIFENVIEGIFQTTPEGRFLTVNPVLARIYGYSSPEELIETITDIGRQVYVNPDERNEFLRIIQDKGVITGFELQLKRKDGSIFWASLNARTVYDENGNALYYEGTTEDITLRKEAEEKLTTTLESLRRAIGATIQVVVATVEARDPYTAGHQRRVTDLARAIATELGLSADRIEGIRMAASIHDIGKISIPAEILSKPARLTNIEFSLMKAHAQYGYEILKDVVSPWPLAEIVLEHHERINGSGYPRGLQGNGILMEAKVLAIADVVESMASHRPYRPSLGIDAALKEIEDNAGILYDREAVEVCMKLFREKGFRFE